MKLHRIILLVIVLLTTFISACSPNETPPATPLRGAIVPTRVTETSTPTLTVDVTAELTEIIVSTPVPVTDEATQTPEPTDEVITPTDEPTEVAIVTDETPVPTEEATQLITPDVINVATEEPTAELTVALTEALPTDEPQPTPTETDDIPTETPTPTLRPENTPTPTSTPTTEIISTPAPIVDIPIVYGDVVTGTINNKTYEARYTFEAEQGDLVSIVMRATNREDGLDGYLTILAPNGAQLVVNDDLNSLESYDPGVVNYPIPQTGTYTIIASRFNGVAGTSAGAFELTLSSGDSPTPTPTLSATEAPSQNALAYGDKAQGDLNNDTPYVAYQFVAQAGDIVGIQVNALSGTLDPQVVLFSPNGAEIALNDDDPLGGFNAYLRDFPIPENGIYTIWATRFNRDQGTSEGRFEILLERVGGGAVTTPVPISENTIAIGDSINGEITNQHFARLYTFSGTEGQIVTFTMRANVGDLDPYLILVDPEGRQIFRNDDGVDLGFNSSLDKVRLSVTGDYTVIATRFQSALGVTQGTFQLTATEDTGTAQALIPVDEIGIGDSVSDGINGGNFHYYGFLAEAGDVITITNNAVSGDLDPLILFEDAYGLELARNDDDVMGGENNAYNYNAAIRDFIIPNTGYYVIAVGYVGETSGQYRIILNRTDTTTTIPQYALLDWFKTAVFADSQQTNFGYVAAGDWVLEEVERRVSSVLTYRLPPLGDRQLASAELNLEICFLSNSASFDLFGELEISMLGYYASDVEIPMAENPNPTPFHTMTSCQSVDMTEVVLEAYNSQATYLQIQIGFGTNTVNRNGAIDSVLFIEPRLKLFFDK